MKKIRELLNRMCPEGVEYELLSALEDRGDITLGRGNVISKTEIRDNPGSYPVYSSSSQNDGKIGEYGKYMFEDERITWSIDGGGILFYRNNHKYSVTNVGGWIKVNTDSLLTRFLYFCLYQQWTDKVFDYTHKAHPSVIRNEYVVPIIPLPIQQEIARILDSFTSVITNLETELASRQKQYEYYRNKLLTFNENDESVEWKTLGDVSLYSKGRINATELDESNYVSVENLLQNKSGKVNSTCCPNEGNWVKYSCGDTLIGNIRPNLRKIWLADIEGGTNGDVLVIHLKDGVRSAIISKYLYYILSSEDFFLYDIQNAKGAKMPRGDKSAVMKFPIAYPSPQRQQEIVSTFDTFESLITNIKQELEARKKQYEYYREQLLTFE